MVLRVVVFVHFAGYSLLPSLYAKNTSMYFWISKIGFCESMKRAIENEIILLCKESIADTICKLLKSN